MLLRFCYMSEITRQRLHLQPKISTLQSGVFIMGDLMSKLMTLYAVKVTSCEFQHEITSDENTRLESRNVGS